MVICYVENFLKSICYANYEGNYDILKHCRAKTWCRSKIPSTRIKECIKKTMSDLVFVENKYYHIKIIKIAPTPSTLWVIPGYTNMQIYQVTNRIHIALMCAEYVGQFWAGALLCGVCMFAICWCRFPFRASSHKHMHLGLG